MRKISKKQANPRKRQGNWRNDLPPKWREMICKSLGLAGTRQVSYHLTAKSKNFILKEQILSEMRKLADANAAAKLKVTRMKS